METIVATVKNILLNNAELGGKLRLTLDKKLKGFKRNDDGTFEQADVDFINIAASAATAQLCSINDSIAEFRGAKQHSFNQAQWNVALRGAQITFNYTLLKAGDKREGSEEALAHDTYDVTFVKCVLSQRALDMIDRVLIAAMMQD
ncbi:MAG: hypothetical protein [Bacteriophage sp.]|nr:MAG: hypothetical protein [Bacteriophage sp.]